MKEILKALNQGQFDFIQSQFNQGLFDVNRVSEDNQTLLHGLVLVVSRDYKNIQSS